MKLITLITFLLFFHQSNSQNIEVADTIIRAGKEDYLIVRNKKLYSNQQIDFWIHYGERTLVNPELLILKNQKTNKKGLISLKEKTVVLPFEYETIYNTMDSAIVIKQNNRKGLFFPLENKLVVANNQKVGFLSRSNSYVLLRNDSMFFYNKKHKLLNTKDSITDFLQNDKFNLIEIERKGKFGVMDYTGKSILPIAFSSISVLDNGNFILGKNGTYSIARRSDLKRLTKEEFSTYTNQNGVIIAMSSDKLVFYDQTGKLLASVAGTLEVIPINEKGDYFFKYHSLWGIVSFNGKIIKKPFLQDKRIIAGNTKYFEGKINNEWKVFDFRGNLVNNNEVSDVIKSNF